MAFDPTVIKKAISGLAKPALGVIRYGLTLVLFSAIWWYDARYLNWAFDVNLALIKGVSSIVDGSGKAEAMMRAFAAEKMLLFGECSALIWAAGRAVSAGFRWLRSRGGLAQPGSVGPPVRQVGHDHRGVSNR